MIFPFCASSLDKLNVVGLKDLSSTQSNLFISCLHQNLFVLCWKRSSAWSEWQRKEIYAWTISNGCLQYTSFQLFYLERSTVSSETQVSYKCSTEIPFIIKQLLLQVFNPFIRQVSLLQCLIGFLWPELKMPQFEFFSCVFTYSSKSELLSRWNYLYGSRGDLTAWSKPRGDGPCPVSPTQENLSSSHVMRWDLGG